jgi:broad specificity phosphatase PhoE
MPQVTFVVICHGQTDDDPNPFDGRSLSPEGVKQVFATGLALRKKFDDFDRLICSGAFRTRQTAFLVALAMDKMDKFLDLEEEGDFHYEPSLRLLGILGGDTSQLKAQMERAADMGNMLSDGLGMCELAREGRQRITRKMLYLTKGMPRKSQKTVIVASHRSWAGLAAVNPATMPFRLPEAAAVIYTVDTKKRRIISSELFDPNKEE